MRWEFLVPPLAHRRTWAAGGFSGPCVWRRLFCGCRSMKWQWSSWCSSTPTSPSAPCCRTARGPWREPIRWAGPPTCLLPPPNTPARAYVHSDHSAGWRGIGDLGWVIPWKGFNCSMSTGVPQCVYLCLVCILHSISATAIRSQVSRGFFFLKIKDFESHRPLSF